MQISFCVLASEQKKLKEFAPQSTDALDLVAFLSDRSKRQSSYRFHRQKHQTFVEFSDGKKKEIVNIFIVTFLDESNTPPIDSKKPLQSTLDKR